MDYYPITNADGTSDKRYCIRREYTGNPNKPFVLRFCGDWIGSFRSIPDATLRAVGHKNPNPPITEVREDNVKLREYESYYDECERANKIPLSFDRWINQQGKE